MSSDPNWKPIGGLAAAIVTRLREQMDRNALAKSRPPAPRQPVRAAAE